MAGKRKYMTEAEIQSLACLPPKQREDKFDSVGFEGLKELASRLCVTTLISLRIATAAWDVLKATPAELESRLNQLRVVMHDYSPGNFPRHAGELEILVDELGILVEDMEGLTAEECLELTKSRRADYAKELDKQRGVKPPRTPA
jgi:hypothetical protein